ISCAATRALIPILHRLRIIDHPNERSSHRVPTPRGGGAAVIGSVLIAWLALAAAGKVSPGIIGIAFGAGGLAVVSWVDDLRELSPIWRLLAPAAAVAIGLLVLPGARGVVV